MVPQSCTLHRRLEPLPPRRIHSPSISIFPAPEAKQSFSRPANRLLPCSPSRTPSICFSAPPTCHNPSFPLLPRARPLLYSFLVVYVIFATFLFPDRATLPALIPHSSSVFHVPFSLTNSPPYLFMFIVTCPRRLPLCHVRSNSFYVVPPPFFLFWE